MSIFWKTNLYVNIALLILYLIFLYWDIQIEKGNSFLGELILYFLFFCCCDFLFQIFSFIIRLIRNKDNKYSFLVISSTFFFITVQFAFLFLMFSTAG